MDDDLPILLEFRHLLRRASSLNLETRPAVTTYMVWSGDDVFGWLGGVENRPIPASAAGVALGVGGPGGRALPGRSCRRA